MFLNVKTISCSLKLDRQRVTEERGHQGIQKFVPVIRANLQL
jgi:hypothetical protein